MSPDIHRLIELALAEDIRSGDIASKACIPDNAVIAGSFYMRQAGIVAGLPILEALYQILDPRVKVKPLVAEGSYQKAGVTIASISGPAGLIISGERTALNLIQHACGVATITAAYVRKVKGLPCKILDTRKTLPGLRALEKYAVNIGGGTNYRFGLDDRCIVKMNHLIFLHGASLQPIEEAIQRIQALNPNVEIEVEVDDLVSLADAMHPSVHTIMLRNMPPREVKTCVERIHAKGKKAYVEASGSITLDTVRAYAETGVDGIAIGALTHSVQDLDIVLRLNQSN